MSLIKNNTILDIDINFFSDLSTKLLLTTNKMSTLETLLLNIIHDMHNAISVIQLETEYLKNHALQNKIEQMINLTRSLQHHINQKNNIMSSCQLNYHINNCLQLCHPLFKHQIIIEPHLSPSIAPIQAVPSQLQQAIINLFLDSMEFMKSIEQPKIVRITTLQEKHNVLMTIDSSIIDTPTSTPVVEVDIPDRSSSPFNSLELITPNLIVIKHIIESYQAIMHIESHETNRRITIRFPTKNTQ